MIASEACKAAGITYRQLDHWIRQGWVAADVSNPGSGQVRLFSNLDIRKARWMGCLVKLGFTPVAAEKIAKAQTLMNEKKFYLGHGVTVTLEPHKHPGET